MALRLSPAHCRFVQPIQLKDGRTITTLADVVDFLDTLPGHHHARPSWENTIELLLKATNSGSRQSLVAARAQFCRALDHEKWLAS